ncbi:hypothetical protein Dsin_000369 [Dipteronia sinensis]|uniref:Endonuclease/exonuclease/phosphatase domain-containing protein n=1 Tax=Dipteronia sinensis TaxID=43782 RepID=A0AAE0EHC9_9ROSI|nr:hypothetical protein Dsin_000369 [Dipteronia sinensis]
MSSDEADVGNLVTRYGPIFVGEGSGGPFHSKLGKRGSFEGRVENHIRSKGFGQNLVNEKFIGLEDPIADSLAAKSPLGQSVIDPKDLYVDLGLVLNIVDPNQLVQEQSSLSSARGGEGSHNNELVVNDKMKRSVWVPVSFMDCISWNVRGMGRAEKRCAVCKLVKKLKPSFLLLQESKVSSVDYRLIKLLGGGVLTKGMIIDAVGSSGGRGLISIWNEEAFSTKACVNTDSCSILLGELANVKKEVVICNVYASNVDVERVELWDFIVTNTRRFLVPWIIGGDFNVVLEASEKIGGPTIRSHLRHFRKFIDEAMLVNLPMQGSPFTWTNAREVASWARLDRFLVSPEILCWFPNLSQRNLPKSISDHSAVLFCIPKEKWGPCPFRFFNSWMENAEVMAHARNSWKLKRVAGPKGFVLATKLKAVKKVFKRWQKEVKLDCCSTDSMEARLVSIEMLAKTNGWSESLRDQRRQVMVEIWDTLLKEERYWRQKARVKWFLEGDRNSNFFHMVCNARRRRNFIDNIVINGALCKGPSQVRKGIFGFFKNQFEAKLDDRPRLEGLEFIKISKDNRKLLEEVFSVEEGAATGLKQEAWL